jgi:hypothetical protein
LPSPETKIKRRESDTHAGSPPEACSSQSLELGI